MTSNITSKELILKEALLEIRKLKKEVSKKHTHVDLEPIAIVGMACHLPGGITSPEEYWQAIVDQKNMISSVPEDRWTDYPREKIENNPYLQKAGFLKEDIEAFDHQLFRLTPSEAARIDPQQRLFLKVSWEAIENAGYAPDALKGSKTGVYAGISSFDHTLKLFSGKEHKSKNPNDLMGGSASFLSGRVSYFFGFQGPGITLDTACSSSLVAIDQACKGLLIGDCDMALAGGVNLMLSPKTTELMASLDILSPNCELRSFDAASNGTVRGEGCGVVILKRLSAAEKDGDKIHAIISASGVNQDGLSAGLTAPHGPSQEKLIHQVWERSKIKSTDIDFMETNGTGTQIGDPIEVSALTNVVGKQRKAPLYLGAIKSAIGNLEAASGVAGVIKTVLALTNKTIPGNVNFEKPSTHINWQNIPIKVAQKNITWQKEKGNRIAAVSSFGLSGTNAHIVLQEYKSLIKETAKEVTTDVEKKWPFRFSAVNSSALKNQIACFKIYIEQQATVSMKDLSYSQNISRVQQKSRVVIWAKDRKELLRNLALALKENTNIDDTIISKHKKIIFLFGNEGSKCPYVCKTFYKENEIFKKNIILCNTHYQKITGEDFIPYIFSNNDQLHETQSIQVASFAVAYALAKTSMHYGIEPTYFMGHGIGEYVAGCLDNVMSLEHAIRLISSQGRTFEAISKAFTYSAPKGRFISNVTGAIGRTEVASARYWEVLNLGQTRFMKIIQSIKNPQDYIFLEMGSTGALTEKIENILGEKIDVQFINSKEETTSKQIEKSVFYLDGFGVDIDWKQYYNKANFTKVFVPNYKFNEKNIRVKEDKESTSTLTGIDFQNLERFIDQNSLSAAERKHLPRIMAVIQNAIREQETSFEAQENNLVSSIHQLKTKEEVIIFIRQTLLRRFGFEEEELRNDESLLVLGIDSIAVTRLLKKWRAALSLSLKPVLFFKKPTIAAWAEIILEKIKSNERDEVEDAIAFVIDEKNRHEKFNFTEVQNAYFVGKNPEIAWGGFTCYGYMEILAGNLDVAKFTAALNQLIIRHEMLRSVNHRDGKQQILPVLKYTPEVYTYSQIKNITKHIADIKNVMAVRTPAYGTPSFELRLTEMAPNNWMIHFGLDFISSDALSINIFWKDLYKIYQGQSLAPITVSFRDYVSYLERRKEGNRYQIDKTYWTARIETLPEAPKLPVDISRNHVFSGFGRKEQLLTQEIWSAFVKEATQQQLTPSAALLTLFSEVLSAWGGENHFGIVLTVFERDNVHPQIDNVIGDFTQLSLLEIRRKQQSIAQNGLGIQAQMQEDLGHSSYSAVDLVREMNHQREGSFAYPVVFTSAIGVSDDLVGLGDKELFGETAFIGSQTPQVWLDCQVLIKNGQLCISWDYMKGIFPVGVLDEMFDTYITLIHNAAHVTSSWNEILTDLRPNNQIQKHQKANNTTKIVTAKTIHQAILGHALTQGEKEAVVCNDASYTYEKLIKRANQVSETIQKNGIAKGDHVAVQMAKSLDMIATVLGIVQVGAVYIPIYKENPLERTSDILHKSNTKVIVVDTDCSLINRLQERVLTANDFDKATGVWKKTQITPDDTAYIIYTSGSTGTPKGVEITHKAADNTIQDINERFKITKADKVLGISSLSFDLSVYDIFGVLGKGGTLVLPTEEERIDPKCWKHISEKHKVTLWNTVPALLEIYANYLLKNKEVTLDYTIKNIFLSGDWIPLNLYDKIKKAIPNAKLISMGGATEAAIWSNYYEVTHIEAHWKSIPYGYPLTNQSFYVLDEFGRQCPDWVKGKLHIGGTGLAKGYYNAKEITAAAFFVHPQLNIPLYDTGDYGRYINDGILEFMGRKDAQLKINGYRVEIGEIQEAFRKSKYKYEAIILAIGDQMKSKKLIAYIQTNPNTFSEKDVKEELQTYIPTYFIPERIIALEAYPKTGNGKIDRKKLMAMYKERYAKQASFPSKTTQIKENHPVLQTVQKAFEMPQLNADDNFAMLGVSSMDIIRLANELEASFTDRPSVVDMIRYESVNDLIAYYTDKGIAFEIEKVTVVDNKKKQQLAEVSLLKKKEEAKNEMPDWKKEAENLRLLVKKCKEQHITLYTVEGALKFKAAKGALTPEIKQELKKNKALLIPYLEALQEGSVSLMADPAYEPFDLTPIQWAYLVGRRKDFELGNIPSHYYAEFACKQESALKFEEALNEVIKNHGALRTVIYDNGTQQLLEELPYFKIKEHHEATQKTVQALRNKWANYEYELGKWPMFHFEICHLSNNKSIIHISLDLMFIDALSGDLMLHEIFNLTKGIKNPVPQLTFKAYIDKEKKWHRDNNYFFQKAETYWNERLKQLPKAPDLPYIKPLGQIEKPAFKRWKFEISVAEVNSLTERAKKNNLTATAVFCTAFMKILYMWSGNQDFTLNLTLFNRLPLHKDAMKILGDFTNVGLASYEPKEAVTFLEEAADLQTQLWELIEHRAKNGLELIRALGKDQPYKATMPIIFTSLLSGEIPDSKENNSTEDFEELFAITQTPQVAIDHQIYRRGGTYSINWDVVEEAFDTQQLSYYFNKYKELLTNIIKEEDWNQNINF